MAETNVNKTTRRRFRAEHRGRGSQVWIYLGKLLRMFVYQNDWKVLPMAALIAGLVGMVIRKKLFINMEGTLMGAFAMVCVCIWNGGFNSIQVICRERDVIKREHRSGMHISSYIFSHMIYQGLLCLMQVAVTLQITKMTGVRYDMGAPLFTKWFIVDAGISMFLITYASDMLSLWISTLAHTTTTAMTIMPFVLIFQLVFSGGMLTLPGWTKPLTYLTVSNPGLKVIAAQADTNNRPFVTISDMIMKMKDSEIGATVTLGQALDMLQDQNNPTVAEIRAKEIGRAFTVGEAWDYLNKSEAFDRIKQKVVLEDMTVGDALGLIAEDEALMNYETGIPGVTLGKLVNGIETNEDAAALREKKIISMTTVGDLLNIIDAAGIVANNRDVQINAKTTVGEAVDWLASLDEVKARRDTEYTFKTTMGSVMDLIGEDKVRTFLEEKAAAASYKADYEYTKGNVVDYWLHLAAFIVIFAMLATITLEFIDKDKR